MLILRSIIFLILTNKRQMEHLGCNQQAGTCCFTDKIHNDYHSCLSICMKFKKVYCSFLELLYSFYWPIHLRCNKLVHVALSIKYYFVYLSHISLLHNFKWKKKYLWYHGTFIIACTTWHYNLHLNIKQTLNLVHDSETFSWSERLQTCFVSSLF